MRDLAMVDEGLQPFAVRLRDSLGCEPRVLIGVTPAGLLRVSTAAGVAVLEAERLCLEAASGLDDTRTSGLPPSTEAGAQLLVWIARQPRPAAVFERVRSIGRRLGFPLFVECWSPEQASDALSCLEDRAVRRASGDG